MHCIREYGNETAKKLAIVIIAALGVILAIGFSPLGSGTELQAALHFSLPGGLPM
ncbi:hypothetical protein KDL44_03880 [bacterium]|nr:hypothetical protein [bacterium]